MDWVVSTLVKEYNGKVAMQDIERIDKWAKKAMKRLRREQRKCIK